VREAYQEEEEATMEDELTPRAFANKLATELSESAGGNGNSSMGEEELMRELIGVQGALRSLAAKLAEAAKDVQLDVIATISVLLRNSRRNKREFRLIDGYSLMKNIFRGIQDYTSVQSQIFLDKIFSIMFTIILDGDRGRLAGNIDALELTFQLACASDLHLEVRIRAVQTIQELLIANALNVVACRRVRGFSQFIEAAVSVDAAHVTGSLSGEQQYVEQVKSRFPRRHFFLMKNFMLCAGLATTACRARACSVTCTNASGDHRPRAQGEHLQSPSPSM
jgi:hypothetical protein